MNLKDFGLASGKWLVGNCGKFPSERNCKLVMLAPENQREDLLDASVAHAVKSHRHTESPELRTQIAQIIETVEV